MKSSRTIALSLALSFVSSLFAIENTGTSALTFLKLDMGGRAAGMAGAYSAVSTDPTATLYNPAGLVQIAKPSALLAHTRWLMDTQLNLLTLATPLRKGSSIGAALWVFNSGDIKETTIYQPQGTGRFFQVNDYLLSLSYAQQMTDRLMIGITAKWIREQILHEQAGAFAFDFGSLFYTGFLNTRLALVLSNYGTSVKFQGRDLLVEISGGQEAYLKTTGWSLPLLFRIGLASELKSDPFQLLLAMDIVDARDAPPRINLGTEWSLFDLIALRAGYRLGYDLDRFTAGVGMKVRAKGLGNIHLDYAYHDMTGFDRVDRISLTLNF